MKEVWRPVRGFKGFYEVSDRGRVRSLDRIVRLRKRGRVLRPGRSSNGYPSVVLSGRVKKSATVHSLVAEAFLGPCPAGKQVRHIDGRRANAAAENLLYGTPKENGQDRIRHGTVIRGPQHKRAKLSWAKAKRIRQLRGRVSQSKLAVRYRVSPAAIQAVMDGRTWTR